MNKKGSVCVTSPIRDLKQINDMKEYLLEHNERDYLMFVLGINTGLRISDLLRLTVEDVKNGEVTIREKKTKKIKRFSLSDTCINAIKQYLEHTGITTGTLFPSKKDNTKPITKEQAWTILKKAADWVGIKENIGTHTLRKTAAYWALKNGVDIAYIMQAYNHSSISITKRYVGITNEELDNVFYKNMNL